MRDPYTILGVAKTASNAEIKKAFRKLAKQYHPDYNKDPKAAARFAEVNQAHEILSDEAKRGRFDRGEIDAEGKPKFQGFEGFANARSAGGAGRDGGFEFSFGGGGRGGFDDILSEMFGGRGGTRSFSARGNDIQASVHVPFTVWALGGKVRVDMPNGRTLDVSIPPGIAEGKAIRLKGQGEEGLGTGKPGDALVSVLVEADPRFRAEGRNIRVDVNVTVYDAVLGGKIKVPTLDGSVEMTLPEGTTGARAFRLKGKGVQAKDGAGDLLVTPRIILPAHPPAGLKQAMEALRSTTPYDPK